MTASQAELNTSVEQPTGDRPAPEQRVRQLAETHRRVRHSRGIALPLLKSPEQYESHLHDAHQHFAHMAGQELTVSYAGEWLLDNFYVIQQALRQVVEDIPSGFYQELPKLADTPLAGLPRVYALARDITHPAGDPLILEQIEAFVTAYQEVTPLTMGELWALPALLRLTNLENLTRAVGELAHLPDRQSLYLESNFPDFPVDETRVANAVINLRMLATQDWNEYFETVSRVEQILRQDPVYAGMNFETRNAYRQVIERITPERGDAEENAAHVVMTLAKQSPAGSKRSHVGYYLLDKGRQQLEVELDYRPPIRVQLARALCSYPTTVYLGSIALITVFVLLATGAYATHAGGSPISVALTLLLTLIPASAVGVGLVNWLISLTVRPTLLPKMDFSEGIPADCRTMVVIPALLSDSDEINSLAQQLELHYLRNNDPHLHFALLADYVDAPEQHLPGDDELLAHALDCIRQLNQRYSEHEPFYFFLRERRWNPSEHTWMGWERKRGKLAEFNRLILDNTPNTSYAVQEGDLSILPLVRYVITLDADTVLPMNSAHTLVGALAHPLNRAQFEGDRLASGYTVLQPRVEIMPTAANRSWFTRIYAGDTGLDLYTRAVSDVYQDWFDGGIFTGKGIYDVAAFVRTLKGRAPKNRLLSHDLFEGVHGRAGLVTDVTLLEDYPPHYLVHARRLHRWIRGDWQLLPWLLPRVPCEDGSTAPNPLSILDRWKIIDNLRRSLLAPALLGLLVAGWLGLPGSVLVWILGALFALALPFLTGVVNQSVQLLKGSSWSTVRRLLGGDALRWLMSLVFLPHEALLAVDAITTTLSRLARRTHLLQWTTAAHTARLFGEEMDASTIWRFMSTTLIFAIAAGLLVALANPSALLIAAPFLSAWLLSPAIASRLSRPVVGPQPPLTDEQRKELRALARRTWLFFERFVGPEDHWLPPDHFQEMPRGISAHHTSPTNIGMMLLSTLAAYDLGYMGLLELSTRFQLTFETLEKLERYRGHFLNWYDTRTLEPLLPHYVSTVDSGNLACCLLALQQGLQDLPRVPTMRPQRWHGLHDLLALLEAALLGLQADETRAWIQALLNALADIRTQVEAVQNDSVARSLYVDRLLEETWPEFTRLLLEALDEERDIFDITHLAMLRTYAERVQHHLHNMQRDTAILLPWLSLVARPPALFTREQTDATMADAWNHLQTIVPLVPLLGEVGPVYTAAQASVRKLQRQVADSQDPASVEARVWCDQLVDALDAARDAAENLSASVASLYWQIEAYLETIDFRFLFHDTRKVFHIGYNVTDERLDDSYYDLLASEARMASLFAISMRQVQPEHWLHLARPQTRVNGAEALLSWSGTMFEYLMPVLLLRAYPDTLLRQSDEAAVTTQMAYAQEKGVPWGISESGYYAFDAHQNYQYRAFGIPDLAFKRGQAADLVVTPYASLLALSIRPQAVMKNIQSLEAQGALGLYGFYEAIDYTASRLSLGQQQAVVREYMAHHQGMILLALANHLHNPPMVERFHANPRIQSVELLLQEQIPKQPDLQYPALEDGTRVSPEQPAVNTAPRRVPAAAPTPRVHFLSNGRYGVLLTGAGGGYSQWQTSALTRWRADTTLEDWGTWVYLRDQDDGALWSVGAQPVVTGNHDVLFYPHKAEYHQRHHDISAQLEITVPPNDDLEIRRLRLTNLGDRARRLLVSSYGEVVLAPQEADTRHPAFNKLFVESEYLPQVNGLLFHRRPRSPGEAPIYLLHLLVVEGEQGEAPLYETDRARFLGRSGWLDAPAALADSGYGLTGTTGATLDPVMALGQEIRLEPHSSVQLAYITLAADSRARALALARAYRLWSTLERAFDQARYQLELEMRQLELQSRDIELIQRMLSGLFYPQPTLRANPQALASNTRGQTGLWAFGISGDYPIVLLRIGDEQDLGLVRDLVRAHTFWRNRGIKTTLVILNQRDTGYTQQLYNQVHSLLTRMGSALWINRHDGIFLLRADLLAETDYALLLASARVFLDASRGSLAEQLEVVNRQPVYLPPFMPSLTAEPAEPTPALARPDNLLFDSGVGGFTHDGREYVIYLNDGRARTPAPWINVIANPTGGVIVSEVGGGYSWAVNSSENRLTAWRNDPVMDRPSEAVYLRDEETAQVWSPTLLPAGADAPYLVRHGHGYSICEHNSHGLKQQTTWFVPVDDPVKVVRLRLENTWDRVRRITVTYYAEWVLGTTRDITQQYLIPEFDPASQTLLCRNPYSIEFGSQYAFITASQDFHGLTADRTEFLGRLGSLKHPAALNRIGLSGAIEAGCDPCAAVQLHVDIEPGTAKEVTFILGAGDNRDAALQLARHYRAPAQVETAWHEATAFWDDLRSTITVNTPDAAMNVILPWLLYQALSCRIWGRSALYQSGGAYGFRDQLQDVTALIHARPDLTREHILRAARHQFEAGDVLHWWHPPSGRGVRTRFSDDLIWLSYVTAHYVLATGDDAILQEEIPFLKGEPLRLDEDERYGFYDSTSEGFTLYEHCRRALDKGLTAGPHGLPLIGGGDWNDGMNRVGIEGRGESVWVGWFLYATLDVFLALCERLSDDKQAAAYRLRMGELRQALEGNAWDGDWYLRAFYDDGAPLGSSQNLECRIDSIAQSWGVISRAADPERARRAMHSLLMHLLKPDDNLLLLFTPPFDRTTKDPGYIKGYPPGIRENGGQYTHAAIWAAWAFAQMGDGEQAEALFRLLNPVYHGDTPEKIERYRVEPYVIAADVYGAPPHTGRGGWTWYTGSSGWMYRLGIEAILGVRREGNYLRIDPRIPNDWQYYELSYRYKQAVYNVKVDNSNKVKKGTQQVLLDGEFLADARIPLMNQKREYEVLIILG
jgi:cyclic beta-1,2-glucan synthetase